jgi:tetratricopeptide (TPR) repeat protein
MLYKRALRLLYLFGNVILTLIGDCRGGGNKRGIGTISLKLFQPHKLSINFNFSLVTKMNGNLVFLLIILPLFLLLFIIARLLTTFFHELGHAIPALAFTKGIVTVFLGSYGDVKKSIVLKTNRRTHVYVKLNPLKWGKGMVQFFPNELSLWKHIFILLLGPLFSLILATIALYVIFSFELNGFLKLFNVIFLVSAIFDLRNIFPNENPIITDNGQITYNDGRQIFRIIEFDNEKKKLSSACKFYAEENYIEAAKLFEELNPKLLSADMLDVMFTTLFKNKNYTKTKEIYTHLFAMTDWRGFSSNNLCNIGLNESYLGEYDIALNYYNQSLELNNNNMFSLLNRGFTYNLMERYAEGQEDFDKALIIDENFAYSYSNRAYSKIKLGAIDDALADINRSIEIDDKNSYAYRNLGLYYFEKGSYREALDNLRLAFDLDPDTHLIVDYIKEAEDKMKLT